MNPPAPQHRSLPRPRIGQLDRINVFFRYRRYVRMVHQRWGLLLGSVVVATGVGVWIAFTSPDIYRAVSRIGVAPRLQTAYHSQAQYQEELRFFYDSQLQYLTSSELMRRVADQMAAADRTPPQRVSTRASKGPGFFTLTVDSTDLDYSRRFAGAWARQFLAYKDERRGQAVDKTAASTRADILRCEAGLQKVRTAILDLQREHRLGSVKEAGDAAQQRLERLQAEYHDLVTLRQRLESKTKEEIANGALGDQTPAAQPAAPASPGSAEVVDPLAKFAAESRYAELKLRLKSREAEYARLSDALKPKHPYMLDLAREIDQRRLEVTAQLELIEEKRVARINSLRRDEESYKPVLETLRQQVLESRNLQYEFDRLRQEEDSIKAVLDNLRKGLQSVELQVLEENLFTIIDEGAAAATPISPNRSRILLLALGLGLALGLTLIGFLDRLDDRFDTAEEIQQALGAPVLGLVPMLPDELTADGRPSLAQMDDYSLFAESLRGVRSAVLLGCRDQLQRVLLIASATPGDGKSTCSVNFALALAMAGHRVLLVDADMRRGTAHTYFGQPREPGLSEALGGAAVWTQVVRTTDYQRLDLLSCGAWPANPGELLLSPACRQLLREARAAYDFVVIDGTPLTGIDDAFSLAGEADGLIFVVRAGQTSMRFARNALAAVQQRGVRLLGLIVNAITADNPHYYYHTYYHHYYRSLDATAPVAPGSEPIPWPSAGGSTGGLTSSDGTQADSCRRQAASG